MADVKWIKLIVGMFDGNSFKRIKKAKIGGESYRDKLTAVWFELMDFAGKCNSGGQLIENPEIPFSSIEDIAIMIDREPDELNLCMQFYISNHMVTVIDDVYLLANWSKYQNEDGLERIREQNRLRQQKWYEKQKALPDVSLTLGLTSSNALDKEGDKEEEPIDIMSGKPDGFAENCREIVEYLNRKAGTNYRYSTDATQTKIRARLKEGFSKEDFFAVIDHRCAEWKTDERMSRFLRPETLFGTKFESYLQAAKTSASGGGMWKREEQDDLSWMN